MLPHELSWSLYIPLIMAEIFLFDRRLLIGRHNCDRVASSISPELITKPESYRNLINECTEKSILKLINLE
jgi:hypothetical protein